MKNKLTTQLIDGVVWIGFFKGLGQVFIWLNTLIIARFLEPKDYGLVGMATLITGLIQLISDFGIGLSIVQKRNTSKSHISTLFWIIAAIGLFNFIGVYMLSPIAAAFFNEPAIVQLLRFSGLALFFKALSDIPQKLLLRDLKYKKSGLLDFTANLSSSILVLILAIRGHGAISIIFGSVAQSVISFLGACFFAKWLPQLVFVSKGIMEYLKFGGAIVMDRILWYTYSNSDYLVLAKTLGKYKFGLYSFAFNLASLPAQKIVPILHPVLFSSFSSYQHNLPELNRQFLRLVNLFFNIFGAIYIGIFWTCQEFIPILLGEKWLPIIPILKVLLIIKPLSVVGSFAPSLTRAIGNPNVGVGNMAIACAAMIPSFLFGSQFGIKGITLVWILVYPFIFLITTKRSMKVAQISIFTYLKQLIPGIRNQLIMSIGILLFHFSLDSFEKTESLTIFKLVGTVFLGSAIWIFCVYRFDAEVWRIIVKLKKKLLPN